MIKNIVFDMGRVLVNYDAKKVCRHYMADEEDVEAVCTSVFVSPEWLLLDMGVISEEAALRNMCARLNGEYQKSMARLCMEHWHEYCMWAEEGMEELIAQLKSQGYGIYLCSNASSRLLDCYQNVIPGIRYFDGVLFSAEVKCIKPQKEMYQHLFERFGLRPEECFFIDDMKINVDGAKACGMDGYCYSHGNLEELKKVLSGLADK